MKELTYYQILGVSRDASDEDITAAYEELVRKLQPEVNASGDFDNLYARVQKAYRILTDAEARSLYDSYLQELEQGLASTLTTQGEEQNKKPADKAGLSYTKKLEQFYKRQRKRRLRIPYKRKSKYADVALFPEPKPEPQEQIMSSVFRFARYAIFILIIIALGVAGIRALLNDPTSIGFAVADSASPEYDDRRQIVIEAFKNWQQHNPTIEFEEVSLGSANIDVLFTFMDIPKAEDYAGLYCASGCNSSTHYAEILVDTGENSCNPVAGSTPRPQFSPYVREYLVSIAMHELGHHFGLDHHQDMNHLLYGPDYVAGEYDTRGYIIPSDIAVEADVEGFTEATLAAYKAPLAANYYNEFCLDEHE